MKVGNGMTKMKLGWQRRTDYKRSDRLSPLYWPRHGGKTHVILSTAKDLAPVSIPKTPAGNRRKAWHRRCGSEWRD